MAEWIFNWANGEIIFKEGDNVVGRLPFEEVESELGPLIDELLNDTEVDIDEIDTRQNLDSAEGTTDAPVPIMDTSEPSSDTDASAVEPIPVEETPESDRDGYLDYGPRKEDGSDSYLVDNTKDWQDQYPDDNTIQPDKEFPSPYNSDQKRPNYNEGLKVIQHGKPGSLHEESEKGHYPWNKCIEDQKDSGHGQETAEKICGAIKARGGHHEECGHEVCEHGYCGKQECDCPSCGVEARKHEEDLIIIDPEGDEFKKDEEFPITSVDTGEVMMEEGGVRDKLAQVSQFMQNSGSSEIYECPVGDLTTHSRNEVEQHISDMMGDPEHEEMWAGSIPSGDYTYSHQNLNQGETPDSPPLEEESGRGSGSNRGTQVCTDCGKPTSHLSRHQQEYHGGPSYDEEDKMPIGGSGKDGEVSVMLEEYDDSELTCPVCHTEFYSPEEIIEHIEKDEAGREGPEGYYSCPLGDDKTFYNWDEFDNHMNQHSTPEKPRSHRPYPGERSTRGEEDPMTNMTSPGGPAATPGAPAAAPPGASTPPPAPSPAPSPAGATNTQGTGSSAQNSGVAPGAAPAPGIMSGKTEKEEEDDPDSDIEDKDNEIDESNTTIETDSRESGKTPEDDALATERELESGNGEPEEPDYDFAPTSSLTGKEREWADYTAQRVHDVEHTATDLAETLDDMSEFLSEIHEREDGDIDDQDVELPGEMPGVPEAPVVENPMPVVDDSVGAITPGGPSDEMSTFSIADLDLAQGTLFETTMFLTNIYRWSEGKTADKIAANPMKHLSQLDNMLENITLAYHALIPIMDNLATKRSDMGGYIKSTLDVLKRQFGQFYEGIQGSMKGLVALSEGAMDEGPPSDSSGIESLSGPMDSPSPESPPEEDITEDELDIENDIEDEQEDFDPKAEEGPDLVRSLSQGEPDNKKNTRNNVNEKMHQKPPASGIPGDLVYNFRDSDLS